MADRLVERFDGVESDSLADVAEDLSLLHLRLHHRVHALLHALAVLLGAEAVSRDHDREGEGAEVRTRGVISSISVQRV